MLEPAVAARFQTAVAVLTSLEAKPSTSKPRRVRRDDSLAESESERPGILTKIEAKVRADTVRTTSWLALFIGVVLVSLLVAQGFGYRLDDAESLPTPQPALTQAPAASAFEAEEDPNKVREALLRGHWSGELAGTQLSVVVNAKGDNLEATAAERDGTIRPTMSARINATGLVSLLGDFDVLDVSHHLNCSGELATGGTSMRGTCADALTGKEGTAKTSTPFTLYTTQESTQ